MASGATFHAKITADAREFIAQVEGAQEALKNLVQETKGAGKAGKTGQASKANKAKKEQKTAQQQAQQAANDLHQKELRNIKKESEERKKAAKEEAAYLKRERQIAQSAFRDLESERRNRRQISVRDEDIRGQRAEGPVRDITDLTRLQKQYTRVVKQEEEHQRKIALYNRQQLDAMVTGRYALYDMANAYQQIAYNAFRVAQAVGFAVANTAKFESAFTAVERAAMLDNTTQSFEYFRQSLIELSTQLPITFEEISNIATLGAQMGVATGNLEQFTRTIAAFSSITGASIDETAERFGRISALAKVPVDEFENLASSVLFAGFNAVATEQEILSMSESIAAAASNAGYSAKQVIGLATALSSLGIAPEQARGVILRVFNTITRAIEGSTDKLGAFADAAGMSAEQAQYLWKESPEQFFTALLNGLGTVEELTLALDELGITNTREINVIQRLSGNMDVYSQSLKEASQAYEEGTALQDIYSKTADNLETKVTQLQNAFTALQAAAGEGLAAALKPAVDFLIQLTRAATEFADSGLGRVILPLVGTVASLAAGFAGIQFVSKIATAQLLAMRVAILKTGQAGLGGVNIFRGLIDALRGNVYATTELGGRLEFLTQKQIQSRVASGLWNQETANMIINSGRASKGVAALSAAMSGLGIAITAASIIGIGAMIYNMNKMQDAVGSNVGGVKALAEAIGRDTEVFNESGKAIATHTIEVQKNADTIKDNANNSNIIIDAQGNIAEQFDTTTGAIVRQTAALGENFKQLLLQDIQESDALENLFENLKNQGTEINDLFGAMGLTIADFVDAAAVDPEAGAFNLLSEGLQNLEANMDSLDEKSQVLARDLLRMAAVDGSLQQNDIQAFISGLGGNVEDLLRLVSDAELGIANSSVYIAQDLGKIVRSVQDGVSASLDQYEILKALGLQFNETTKSLENWNEEQEEGEETANGLSRSLRTVLDYASDLSGIFNRIVGIEFGTTDAEDDIADAWEKIGERADKAREAIEDANNEIKELTADRAVLEYQLSVAERYGDERRAMQIRAKLGQVDAKLADESEKLADAQDEVSMTLEGQTKAARENRDAVDGLVGSYMDLIQAAVESGMQGQELEDYIESLKEEFYANGEAVGYSRNELEKYGALFDQFKTAVQQVDPRIDIQFDTNLSAVQNALNEFEASLNRIDGKKAETTVINKQEDVHIVRTQAYPLKVNGSDVRLFRMGLEGGHLSYADYIKMVYGITKTAPGVRGSFLLRASGGLISGPGTSTSDSIPTMLSNGEYVIQAKAVSSYGVDFMNAINQQRVPMTASAPASAAVSGGSTIAYLAPEDRALLRSVADRPVTLYADNTKIAQSANAGNQTLSQRGLK
jgi:TP901 family phage tail tape measure protein